MRVISPSPPLCDAVGGALNYLGSECDHMLSMPACAQTAYRASTAVEEPIKLGNPGGKHQPGTGSRRATGAAWRAVGADITGCCSHLCAVWEDTSRAKSS